MNAEKITYKCPWCEVIKPLRGLCCHASKKHGQSSSEVHRLVLHDGKVPLCACGCGQEVNWLQRTYGEYLRGHNGFSDDARKKASFVRNKKYELGLISSWNEGLKKEKDERVAAAAVKTSITNKQLGAQGVLSAWRKDSDKHAAAKLKLSNTMKAKHAALDTSPWNKGLTKIEDPRLNEIAEKISATRKLSNNTTRFTVEQVRELIMQTNVFNVVEPLRYQNKYDKFEVACKTMGHVSLKNVLMLKATPVCHICHPKESKGQLEIFDFVRSVSPDAVISDRTVIAPKELDVYVPSKNFAIEYDGLYWHSNFFHRSYGNEKRDLCRMKNVSCIRVFEDEWRDKRLIIEWMIKHRLGVHDYKIGARETEITELTVQERRDFFERNHLEGDVKCSFAYGLKSDGKIVAAASFREPFHRAVHNDAIELARFASQLGISVPGALSRLVKRTIERVRLMGKKRLLTYVDTRIGEGASYINAGFKLQGETIPRFWWTDYIKRYNRFAIRADKKNGLTQAEAAKIAKVVEIYGCSNKIYDLQL